MGPILVPIDLLQQPCVIFLLGPEYGCRDCFSLFLAVEAYLASGQDKLEAR